MSTTNETPRNSSEEKTQLVQMRLRPNTLERLQSLADLTKTDNKTQLVSTSIKLTEEILKNVYAGAKIYIEQPDGKREVLKFIGL